jgi:hypothetical protein
MTLDVVDAVTRAVCWTAGIVEGVVGGLVNGRAGVSPKSHRTHDRHPRRFAASAAAPRPTPTQSDAQRRFVELRATLLGKTRRQIVRALGAPPTASVGFGVSVVTGGAPLTFMHASTWYYPFDPGQQQAVAIRFVDDRARGVEFIGGLQEVVAEA